MKLKPGVSLQGLHEKMPKALRYFSRVYTAYNRPDSFVITSGTEDPPDSENERRAQHSAGSLHPCGRAVDIRTRDFTPSDMRDIVSTARDELGPDYDIVLEKDHLHVEYDPKET